MTDNQPLLFSPLAIRGVTLPNRIVVAPMAQYSAVDGVAGDWHFANLSKYALGGAGLIFSEALAVERRGMVTPGCSGLWNDDQVAPWKRINAFLKSQGAVPGVQLAHSGRRGSAQPPVKGGRPLTEADDANGHAPWPTAAPSAEPWGEG